MRLIEDGPDIPASVLTAHQNGKLVFFCGAGISFLAGLPSYAGLLDRIATALHHTFTSEEIEECQKGYLDRVASSLEKNFTAKAVRQRLKEVLTPTQNANVDLHKALIELSRDKEKNLHLVTTNYDGLFERADPLIRFNPAPALPVPKLGRWNSLVYLHGKISAEDPECKELVFTSSDFGRAYLSERWASAFVTELFRNFVVIFIGYSLEDPVMRYMMDALAAERQSRDDTDIKPAFAFAPFDASEGPAAVSKKWEEKGVTPIPCDKRDDHRLLHDTIKKWASGWNDGLLSKAAIISRFGIYSPNGLNQSQIEQVVEALNEEDGSIAQLFVQQEPPPPIAWLPVFENAGLLSKLSPIGELKPVSLVGGFGLGHIASPIHPVTYWLGIWLAKHHLEKRELVEWVVSKGCQIHPGFKWSIERNIKTQQVREPYRRIWRILTSAVCVKDTGVTEHDALDIERRLNTGEEWTPELRNSLLSLLKPSLEIRKGWTSAMSRIIRGSQTEAEPEESAPEEAEPRLRDFIDGEVRLGSGQLGGHLLNGLNRRTDRAEILKDIAWAVTECLSEAFQLLALVDEAFPGQDSSYTHRPSISPHSQNQGFQQWDILVDLARDSHIALEQQSPQLAEGLRAKWLSEKYPIFWRLALDGISGTGHLTEDAKLSVLLDDHPNWLWSFYVQREVHRLVLGVWSGLSEEKKNSLIAAILQGAPDEIFREDIGAEELQRIKDREIWRYLAFLSRTDTPLPATGTSRLAEIQQRYPRWRLAEDERDTFPTFMESSVGHTTDISADEIRALSNEERFARLTDATDTWLREGRLDTFQSFARQESERAIDFLEWLASDGRWDGLIWQHAFYGFAELPGDNPVWQRVFGLLLQAPEEMLTDRIHAICSSLTKPASAIPLETLPLFLQVWDRLLPVAGVTDTHDTEERVTAAINHPAGQLAEILTNIAFKRGLKGGSGLPEDLRPFFDKIAVGEGPGYDLGRLILASRVHAFHAVDPEWARQNVLPCFSWANPSKARDAWQGFLWIGRLSIELIRELKIEFLASFGHGEEIGHAARNLYRILGITCIDFPETITNDEAHAVLGSIDDEGRASVVSILTEYVAKTENLQGIWENRIRPWIDAAWPRQAGCRGPEESSRFARLAIEAKELFPEVFEFLRSRSLLTHASQLSLPLNDLRKREHTTHFPRPSLEFLNAIVPDDISWDADALRDDLQQIVDTDGDLRNTPEYRRLAEILRRRGIGPP